MKCSLELAYTGIAACRVATSFLNESRSLGLKEKEGAMVHELVAGKSSLYASADALSKSELHKAHPSLKEAATKLATLFKQDTGVNSSHEAGDGVVKGVKNTKRSGRLNSTGIVVQKEDPVTGMQVLSMKNCLIVRKEYKLDSRCSYALVCIGCLPIFFSGEL
jgi:hypothetical protein